MNNVGIEHIFWIQSFWVDVLEVFSLYINGFRVSIESLERKVNIEIVLICYLYMSQLLALLQENRSLHIFTLVGPVNLKGQSGCNIDHLVIIDINCVEDLFLHGQDIEVA